MTSSPGPLPSPLERRVILLVALVQLVNVLDFVMVMPLGQDFADALAIPESRLGLVGGSYTASAAIAGLIASRFLDRFDRRRALTVAMLGLVAATAAGGFAQGLGSMMAARVVAGAFGGPATSVALAIVADVVPIERRGRALGVVMAAFSVASVIGIPAGLAAAQAGSWRTPFFALAGLGLGVTLFAAIMLPSLRLHLGGDATPRTPTLTLIRRPEIVMALAATAAMTFSVFMIVPYVRSFIENNHGYPPDRVMYLYLVGGIASFVVVRITGGVVDRVGSAPVAAFGTLLISACLVIGFLPERPVVPIMLVFAAFMCTASLRGVPLSTLTSRLPAPHERAQYMSLQSATQHLAAAAGAVLASQILATAAGGRLVHMDTLVFLSVAIGAAMPVLLWRIERGLPPRAVR